MLGVSVDQQTLMQRSAQRRRLISTLRGCREERFHELSPPRNRSAISLSQASMESGT